MQRIILIAVGFAVLLFFILFGSSKTDVGDNWSRFKVWRWKAKKQMVYIKKSTRKQRREVRKAIRADPVIRSTKRKWRKWRKRRKR